MAHSSSNDPSPTEVKQKRYVCQDCDKAFSTSSHLGRHSRVHTGVKDYKCDWPGCETRCSRQDNLQAHKRVHLQGSKPKKSRGNSAASSDSHPSPASSSSSSSPTDFTYRPSPPEMFRTPASRFSMSASNSPQPMMSAPLPQIRGGPSRGPYPLYDGYSPNSFPLPGSPASHSRTRLSGSHIPYPPRLSDSMPPPIVHGSPDESLEGFNPGMLLQNAPPLQRRGSLYQPYPQASTPSVYPYATYPPPTPIPQYGSNPSSPGGSSHPPSPEFPNLHQLPRY
ncbi:hypothetical protein B0H19DRAFT_1250139 [Mycena capillaripes]|nr:hypothetical protein B0H19DRAFT_1250139 [Mycena capillaripes]